MNTMKAKFAVLLPLLLMLFTLTTLTQAQAIPDNALRGQAHNILIPADGPFFPSVGGGSCFPLTGSTTSLGTQVECTGSLGTYGTAPITANYTTITFTISSPVLPGELLEIAAVGSGLSIAPWCAIQPGQRFCSQTFPSFTVTAGGPVGAVIRRFNPSTQAFPLTEVSWAVF